MKSFCSVLVAVTIALATSASFASQRHLARYDISCQFHSVRAGGSDVCEGSMRLYKTWSSGDESLQPVWGANRMSIACNGEELYVTDGEVLRIREADGIHWEVRGASEGPGETPIIDLGTEPFTSTANPSSQNAQLEFSDGQLFAGSCQIDLNHAF
jgi:hypothetical protein